jgi:hypothetical protein
MDAWDSVPVKDKIPLTIIFTPALEAFLVSCSGTWKPPVLERKVGKA